MGQLEAVPTKLVPASVPTGENFNEYCDSITGEWERS
jgi:hypothetical protein